MQRKVGRQACVVVAWWMAAAVAAVGQQEGAAGGGGEARQNLETIRSLIEVIKPAEARLAELRREAEQAGSAEEREAVGAKIEAEKERIEQLRGGLRRVAAGLDEDDYQGREKPETNLQQKLDEVLGPLLDQMQEATAGPREMERLRAQRAVWVKRRQLAEQAVARIAGLRQALGEAPDQAVIGELAEAERLWEARQAEAASEIGLADEQLAAREKDKRPLTETISDLFSQFWGNRAVNLVLALVAMAATLGGGRWLYLRLRRRSPLHRNPGTLTARAADVAATAGLVLAAVCAGLLVLYLRGDWMLLTLAAILLFGVAWAARRTLPPHLEQLRLMLNLGGVREGERIVHGGLPWRVDRLGLHTVIANPELAGGTLRLPLKTLVTLRSRRHDPKEPWFPTRDGDWVVMADGTFGRVDHQTPEQVVLVCHGGSRKTYQVCDFLAGKPENLSHGFRIKSVFGVDYRHQAIAAAEIPAILQGRLAGELTAEVGRPGLRSLRVEFRRAGASSLDYAVLADFSGGVAARRTILARLIQRVCLEVCNEQGWTIPFNQVTVHRAGDRPAAL